MIRMITYLTILKQNNIDIRGVLSSCWKDNQVDAEERGLELMKVLVDNQADIFASLGVQFPTWDNRPLAIIDMVHCLAQYTKYCEIQRDLSRQYVKKCDSVTVSAKQICLIRNHLTVSVLSPSTKKLKTESLVRDILSWPPGRTWMSAKPVVFATFNPMRVSFAMPVFAFIAATAKRKVVRHRPIIGSAGPVVIWIAWSMPIEFDILLNGVSE